MKKSKTKPQGKVHFAYISRCCTTTATKDPAGETGLGKWNCSKCGQKCVVDRHILEATQ